MCAPNHAATAGDALINLIFKKIIFNLFQEKWKALKNLQTWTTTTTKKG